MNYMSLITCPECGKEVSDKAISCPNCGICIKDVVTQNKFNQSKTRNEDYIIKENFTETGYTGRKRLACPQCGGKNILIMNDIPLLKKMLEILTFGAVTPFTKDAYRKQMSYYCKTCGAKWKEDEEANISEADSKKNKRVSIIILIAGIVAAIFSVFTIFVILTSDGKISGNFLHFIYALFILIGGIMSMVSIIKNKVIDIACLFYGFGVIMSAILMFKLQLGVWILIIPLIFFGLSTSYRKRLI